MHALKIDMKTDIVTMMWFMYWKIEHNFDFHLKSTAKTNNCFFKVVKKPYLGSFFAQIKFSLKMRLCHAQPHMHP